MLPAIVNANSPEPQAAVVHGNELFEAYLAHMAATGRGNITSERAARLFIERWPNPQAWATEPLSVRLSVDPAATSLVMMCMTRGWLQPGWDWLVYRKLSSFWASIQGTPIGTDMARFRTVATGIGFTPLQAKRAGSQSVGRMLFQTGRPLDQLTLDDFEDLRAACVERSAVTGKGWHHYRGALVCAQQVLFHLNIVDQPPKPWNTPETFDERMKDSHRNLRPDFVAYLERKTGSCHPKTVSSLATRIAHFGRFLAEADPGLESLAGLDRRIHIEPYLTSVTKAVSAKTGQPISLADQDRRIRAMGHMLEEITEWGWQTAPKRRLVFRSDYPRLAKPLPRYLPVDADRRLSQALADSDYRLAADALLLARATGIRIGELVDLELDCVHDVTGHGSWLKVPLGKLQTERMVPLDEETVALIDQIVATRAQGRPILHPRSGRPTQFLLTHHGRRLSSTAIRQELARSSEAAGIGHVTPHQLRHTYATALVNAGVSLQALMALLGHVSAQMSLRYAHLFDSTVRAEYERALDQARSQIGAMPSTGLDSGLQPGTPDGDWRDAPLVKSRLGGGHCLRAPVQGACEYANICEQCPSFRVDEESVAVLGVQRADVEVLMVDAESRGWGAEADRHRLLLDRLDSLIQLAVG